MFGQFDEISYRCDQDSCQQVHLGYAFTGLPDHPVKPDRLSTVVELDGIEAVGHAGITKEKREALHSVEAQRSYRRRERHSLGKPPESDEPLTDCVAIATDKHAHRLDFHEGLGWIVRETIIIEATPSDDSDWTPTKAVDTMLRPFEAYDSGQTISTTQS